MKRGTSERVQNEIETSNLSDIKLKVMITRILKELSDNYKELSGNYISMKKDIKTMNENKEEMKNIVQAIKSRLDEPED